MNYFEIMAMAAALAAMAGALAAKVCTTRLIQRMQHQVDTVSQSRQVVLGRLKKAELQHCVVKRNRDQLEKKKAKLERRKVKIGTEVKKMRSAVARKAKLGVAA